MPPIELVIPALQIRCCVLWTLGISGVTVATVPATAPGVLTLFQMSQATRYRSDGCGRDAYIHEQIRKPARISDLKQRRDTLPDNVYKYLEEQIHREEYQDYTRKLQLLGNAVNTEYTRGRRTMLQDGAASAEEATMASLQTKHLRHHKIKVLYEQEMEMWQEELRSRGLAIEAARE
eukprot:TRINITY_DN3149_c0_g1_i1.p1 TRINITY_DN3149_c0_g1~~TRINITY_DN3149_c0_g1_i1.p1  ORF type:complete len:177 (+),score=25.75 TRINITY_DN3149_c0_g1_i1:785-1315(+)